MKKISLLLLLCGIINASEPLGVQDEIGVNIGATSIKNENGFHFDNQKFGVSYQVNGYIIHPRVDFDYTNVTDYGNVNYLVKGSLNGVYEYETGTNFIPYVLGGAGYEAVGGEVRNIFDDNFFIQGGMGLAYEITDGIKAKAEGKLLQIVGADNQENEVALTLGVSAPLDYFNKKDNNECPIKISAPDEDRDGVRDSVDQCPNTPCYFTVDSAGCPLLATLRLHFDVDKYTIREESIPKVENFAIFLLKNKGTMVEITGHTDSDGSDEYNMILSENRARSVVEKLISFGVSPYRLSYKGMGESMPVASNETELGKSLNRRIEAKLIYPKNREGVNDENQ